MIRIQYRSTREYFQNTLVKVRYSSFLRIIFDAVAKTGIRITPYYLLMEGLFGNTIPHLETGFTQYEIGFLGPEDLASMASIPGRNISEVQLRDRMRKGKKCLAAKFKNEIIAFTWCGFDECASKYFRFTLKDNEAYLFDAYTLMKFRGKGVAPYLRYQLYKELQKWASIDYIASPMRSIHLRSNSSVNWTPGSSGWVFPSSFLVDGT